MGTSNAYIMTISNSIIGVSVLAMPFCFKQCGIVLSSLMLVLSSILSRSTSHFLLKSAIMSRRRNYEFLAFHVFGSTGKTFIELSIIGFMMGTCIAFFVVMGDLGPAILSNVVEHVKIETLRPTVLMCLAMFIVLPLGLLRNVDSLSAVSTATILFYLCLVLKVIAESSSQLVQGSWAYEVDYWNPAGLLQCLPIFSMALFCQTQLFDIFESMPNLSLDRMNSYIGSAVNMCTAVYMSVGFFGYIAYYKYANLTGNVLLSFSPNISSEVIKFGFVLSIAVSFPLVIFPCRASIYSLLFRKPHTPHYESMTTGANHIPEMRFRCITLFIILVSLSTAMIIPNIELVLGLVGSTIGILICVLLPCFIFVTISNKKTTEQLFAKCIFGVGILVMILGTYANLFATEKAMSTPEVSSIPPALQIRNNEKEMIHFQDSVNLNNKLIVQEMDNKIEKPMNLETKKQSSTLDMSGSLNNEKDKSMNIKEEKKQPNGDNKEMEVILKNDLNIVKKNITDKLNDKIENKKDEKVGVNVRDESISINKEAILLKEEKEIKNDDQMKINHEQEILDKLKKQEEEQKKIMKQQEIILNEVRKQNEKLDEIKQQEEIKNTKSDSNNKKYKIEFKNKGNLVMEHQKHIANNEVKDKNIVYKLEEIGMNRIDSNDNNIKTNNLISEQIKELNKNVNELNKEEVKITNQINKVKENILLENNNGQMINNNQVNHQNEIPVNTNNVQNNMIPNTVDGQKVSKNIQREDTDIINSHNSVFMEVPKDLNYKKEVINNVGTGVGTRNNLANDKPNKALENKILNSKPPLPLILQQNEIQYNKTELKNQNDERIVKNNNNFVNIPNDPNLLKNNDQNIIKTRDILEHIQREKRDTRIEPVNPLPPDYDVHHDVNHVKVVHDFIEEVLKDSEILNINNNFSDSEIKNNIVQKEENIESLQSPSQLEIVDPINIKTNHSDQINVDIRLKETKKEPSIKDNDDLNDSIKRQDNISNEPVQIIHTNQIVADNKEPNQNKVEINMKVIQPVNESKVDRIIKVNEPVIESIVSKDESNNEKCDATRKDGIGKVEIPQVLSNLEHYDIINAELDNEVRKSIDIVKFRDKRK